MSSLKFSWLCLVLVHCALLWQMATAKSSYDVSCLGHCEKDFQPTTPTVPGVVLMGGGTDTDEAFAWQIANAKGGDFVVLRSSGTDAYNQYVLELAAATGNPINSVRTIIFNSKDASSDNDVLNIVRNAEAVFLAGGDQSSYLSLWKNTPLQSVLQDKLQNITIGGTSAGCMVQSNWIYSAEVGSVDSSEALANPYHRYITFSDKLLRIPYLESVLLDTHFVTRDRMGRLMTFLARIMKDVDSKPPALSRGIGVDEHTALLLNPLNGDVSIVGVGTAYICTADHKASVCESRKDLTFENVACVRLDAKKNEHYSFSTWSGDGKAYSNNVVKGAFTNNAYGL